MALLPTLFSITLSTLLFPFVQVEANSLSFSTELIHRDSPNSPFFNASVTLVNRLTNALHRSTKRVTRFNLLPNSNNEVGIHSNIIPGDGNFLMKISIGTPPTEILAAIDTTSNFIWIPSKKCDSNCPKNSGTIFNPISSSTYKQPSCDSYQCRTITSYCGGAYCFYKCDGQNQQNCPNGIISTDTFTFISNNVNHPQQFSFPNIIFACGFQIDHSFAGVGSVGLDHHPLSLTSQLYSKSDDGKFSYCLGPYFSNQSSKINFGPESFDSSNESDLVSTPLGNNTKDSNYYITLDTITVGNESIFDLDFSMSSWNPAGNTLIDSGTLLTHLPEQFYNKVAVAVAYALPQRGYYYYKENTLNLKDCYQYSSDFNPPRIVMNFKGEVDLELSPSNSFIRISEDLICFAFQIAPGNTVVYGSWQQTNFLVGYDLKQRTVSFKKADCTKS